MRKILLFTICSLAVLSSCNKNDLVEEDQPMAPEITLDSETGIYTVKVGRALTIAPDGQVCRKRPLFMDVGRETALHGADADLYMG